MERDVLVWIDVESADEAGAAKGVATELGISRRTQARASEQLTRATMAGLRCQRFLEDKQVFAARVEYFALQEALSALEELGAELRRQREDLDASIAGVRTQERRLGRILASGLTPTQFKRSP